VPWELRPEPNTSYLDGKWESPQHLTSRDTSSSIRDDASRQQKPSFRRAHTAKRNMGPRSRLRTIAKKMGILRNLATDLQAQVDELILMNCISPSRMEKLERRLQTPSKEHTSSTNGVSMNSYDNKTISREIDLNSPRLSSIGEKPVLAKLVPSTTNTEMTSTPMLEIGGSTDTRDTKWPYSTISMDQNSNYRIF